MKKLIALILLICMITTLIGCKKQKENQPTPELPVTPPTENNGGGGQTDGFSPTIVVPEYKDYGRGSVNFGDIIYTRPGIQALITAFENAAATVGENKKSIDAQIEELRSLEAPLSNVKTMYSLVEINQRKDSSIPFWKDEAEYIGTYYPELTKAVEDLMVACARSEHKSSFESDYFGYSLDEYIDGGIYTDEVVELMQREAELEAEYSSLSTATVEISYKRTGTDRVFEGTVDEVKAELKEFFGTDETGYKNVLSLIDTLYKQKLDSIVRPIYVELIKVRRLIANSLGYTSYTELAYGDLDYGYTSEDMLALLSDVGKYVSEVSAELQSTVFGPYFPTTVTPTLNQAVLINNLYEVYAELGGSYKDAYSYMLQHGLYDVSLNKENRYNGAFATYLENNSSPYLFVTASGFIKDYTVLAHEFGHFLDGYINYGKEDSLIAMEVSSQALELLTLSKLKNELYSSDYKYLEYYTVYTLLKDVLLAQSFYALFEHLAYAIDYEKISEAELNAAASEAYRMIFGENTANVSFSNVCIPHTVLYPCYVESYVTSAIISLDIFFTEKATEGKGFELYEALINRGDANDSFTDRLEALGAESPFAEGKVKEMADGIYFYLTKSHYFSDISTENAA